MSRLRLLVAKWNRTVDAARRELLRDPNVILFERAAPLPETVVSRGVV